MQSHWRQPVIDEGIARIPTAEAQLPGCLGEAPTADAVGISKEAGRRVPLAHASGWIWPQSVTFLTRLY